MSTEWRAYVRVDREAGQIILEMSPDDFAAFCVARGLPAEISETPLSGYPCVFKPRSDETTLPGVRR